MKDDYGKPETSNLEHFFVTVEIMQNRTHATVFPEGKGCLLTSKNDNVHPSNLYLQADILISV